MLFKNFLLGLIVFGGQTVAQAQPVNILDQITKFQAAIVEVTAENFDMLALPSQGLAIDPQTGRILRISNVRQSLYKRSGAGVVIHPSGVIVTNAHTIYKANRIRVIFHDHTWAYASVVRFINNLDLALLKIPSSLPLARIPIADSDHIRLGESIFMVGNSFILNKTISEGKVRGIGKHILRDGNEEIAVDLIQTSFDVYAGDSGGPLFDGRGRLIGMITAKEAGADHSSFAVPSNKIVKYLSDYLHEAESR